MGVNEFICVHVCFHNQNWADNTGIYREQKTSVNETYTTELYEVFRLQLMNEIFQPIVV